MQQVSSVILPPKMDETCHQRAVGWMVNDDEPPDLFFIFLAVGLFRPNVPSIQAKVKSTKLPMISPGGVCFLTQLWVAGELIGKINYPQGLMGWWAFLGWRLHYLFVDVGKNHHLCWSATGPANAEDAWFPDVENECACSLHWDCMWKGTDFVRMTIH